MRINVGSMNPVKIEAVRNAIRRYDILSNLDIGGVEVSSGVSEQPMSLDETVRGAYNRARNSFGDCELSFGIESGLIEVPFTRRGYMDTCACIILDEDGQHHIGLSRAFELPIKAMGMILREGIDIDTAFHRCGLTEKKRLGYEEGAIGLLTSGKVTRINYTQDAVEMALIGLRNRELYTGGKVGG